MVTRRWFAPPTNILRPLWINGWAIYFGWRLSKSVAMDLRLRKSDRSPALAKLQYCDRLSGARPGDPEASPTDDRRGKLRQHRNCRWHQRSGVPHRPG